MTLCDSQYGRERLNLGIKYCNLFLRARGHLGPFPDETGLKIAAHPVMAWKYAVWPSDLHWRPADGSCERSLCRDGSTVLDVLTALARSKASRTIEAMCRCAGSCGECSRFGRSARPTEGTIYAGLQVDMSEGVSYSQSTKDTRALMTSCIAATHLTAHRGAWTSRFERRLRCGYTALPVRASLTPYASTTRRETADYEVVKDGARPVFVRCITAVPCAQSS